jgi:hypothetical protein
MDTEAHHGRGPGFAANKSGINRTGRPVGSGGIKGQMLTALKEGKRDWKVLLYKAYDMAAKGDVNALTFLLGRIIPSAKQADHLTPFPIPDNVRPGDLPGLMDIVIRAVAAGSISAEAAQRLGMAVSAAVSVHAQDDDVNKRLADLERRINLRLGTRNIEGEVVIRRDADDGADPTLGGRNGPDS